MCCVHTVLTRGVHLQQQRMPDQHFFLLDLTVEIKNSHSRCPIDLFYYVTLARSMRITQVDNCFLREANLQRVWKVFVIGALILLLSEAPGLARNARPCIGRLNTDEASQDRMPFFE